MNAIRRPADIARSTARRFAARKTTRDAFRRDTFALPSSASVTVAATAAQRTGVRLSRPPRQRLVSHGGRNGDATYWDTFFPQFATELVSESVESERCLGGPRRRTPVR